MKKDIMKKHIAICLAAAACLLAACHSPAQTPPSGGASGSPVGADSPPVTTSAQPAPEAPPTAPRVVALPNGPFPDSAYAIPEKPERYYEGAVDELIPSDGYGRIWPYIGAYIDTIMGTRHDHFGICDENGRIICDPVYNDVKLIENGRRTLYAFIKYDIVESGGNYEQLNITTLCALDGSWAETFEHAIWEEQHSYEYATTVDRYGYSRSYGWRGRVRYDYITARRGGAWGVLDWDGSVRLPFEYAEPVCFHEGLASVLSANGRSYSFIDIAGKTVLGPFEAPPRPVIEYNYSGMGIPVTDKILFYEGFAKYFSNGKYGIIDRVGNVVVPAEYDFITCMNGGVALFVFFSEGDAAHPLIERLGVVNDSGDVIAGPSELGIFHSGTAGQVIIDRNGVLELVDYDGSRTPYPHQSTAPFNLVFSSGEYVFREADVRFPMNSYWLETVNDDLIIVFDRRDATWRLYDYEGSPVSPQTPGKPDVQGYMGRKLEYLLINASAPDEYVWPPLFMIYGLDGMPLLDGAFYSIVPVGDRFMVRGKSYSGLVDNAGEYIIKVSTFEYEAD